MTTYNTGNPIGSTDPRDLSDNSENFDRAVNNIATATWVDRFGVSRVSLGYVGTGAGGAIESYASGLVMGTYNTIILYSGEFYRPSASATLPYTTTATLPSVDSNLASVGDAVLRQDLASSPSNGGGALLVTGIVQRVSSRTEMKSYDVPAGYQFSLEEGGRSGLFVVKTGTPPADTQEGIYVALTNGDYAERLYSGAVKIKWFGAVGDGATDDTTAVSAALGFSNFVDAEDGAYVCTSIITTNISALVEYRLIGGGAIFDFSSLDSTTAGSCLSFLGSSTLKFYASGIKLVGQYQDVDGVLDGLEIDVCAYLNLDGVDVSDIGHSGVLVLDVKGSGVISNSTWYRCGYGGASIFGNNVVLENVASTLAGRPVMGEAEGYGVNFNGTNGTIRDCVFADNKRYNIDVRNHNNVKVLNNNLSGAGFANIHAINESSTKSFSDGLFQGNVLDGAGVSRTGIRTGVFGTGSTNPVGTLRILDNILKNHTGTTTYGIIVYCENDKAPNEVVITGNLFQNNIGTSVNRPINLRANASGTSIKYAEIKNNLIKEAGFISLSSADVVHITGNTLQSSVDAVIATGILVDKSVGAGTFAMVRDNDFHSTNGSYTNPIDITSDFALTDKANNYLNGVGPSVIYSRGNFNKVTHTVSSTGSRDLFSITGAATFTGIYVNWHARAGFSSARVSESGTFILDAHFDSSTPVIPGVSPYTIPMTARSENNDDYTLSVDFIATVSGSTITISASTASTGGDVTVYASIESIGSSAISLL